MFYRELMVLDYFFGKFCVGLKLDVLWKLNIIKVVWFLKRLMLFKLI